MILSVNYIVLYILDEIIGLMLSIVLQSKNNYTS